MCSIDFQSWLAEDIRKAVLGLCYENQATYLGILFWIDAYLSKSQIVGKITVVSNPWPIICYSDKSTEYFWKCRNSKKINLSGNLMLLLCCDTHVGKLGFQVRKLPHIPLVFGFQRNQSQEWGFCELLSTFCKYSESSVLSECAHTCTEVLVLNKKHSSQALFPPLFPSHITVVLPSDNSTP